MSSLDNAEEKIDVSNPNEGKSVESDVDQEADKQQDLEQIKRITTQNIEGNVGQTQIFIQSVGIHTKGYLQPQTSGSEVAEKQYDLRKQEECIEFVERYQESEYLLIAITLSTFEVVALGDLQEIKEKLEECLRHNRTPKTGNAEEWDSSKNTYIALNTILSVIGGQRFKTKNGRIYVGLGEGANQALVHFWEQFPILRDTIASWLINLKDIYGYRTTFDASQIAIAFARVAALDFEDAKSRIFPYLYAASDNIGLLGAMVYHMYEDEALKNELNKMIQQWLISYDSWLWKPACLVYSLLMNNNESVAFENQLKKHIEKRILKFDDTDLSFVSNLLLHSKHLRDMFAQIFMDCYEKMTDRQQRKLLAQVYVSLIRNSYFFINSHYTALPLVACDTKIQQQNISEIVGHVMSIYYLRKQLYAIMEAYLKELCTYNISHVLVLHISAFFYNMMETGEEYQEDVLDFLKKSENKLAKQIYQKLDKI